MSEVEPESRNPAANATGFRVAVTGEKGTSTNGFSPPPSNSVSESPPENLQEPRGQSRFEVQLTPELVPRNRSQHRNW